MKMEEAVAELEWRRSPMRESLVNKSGSVWP